MKALLLVHVGPFSSTTQIRHFMHPCVELPNHLTLTSSDFTRCRRIKNRMMSDLLVSQRTVVYNACMDLICWPGKVNVHRVHAWRKCTELGTRTYIIKEPISPPDRTSQEGWQKFCVHFFLDCRHITEAWRYLSILESLFFSFWIHRSGQRSVLCWFVHTGSVDWLLRVFWPCSLPRGPSNRCRLIVMTSVPDNDVYNY